MKHGPPFCFRNLNCFLKNNKLPNNSEKVTNRNKKPFIDIVDFVSNNGK